ncbi:MAG: excinuclease ABC subunit UvrB [bacterium]|nr:excinuclease ABC subunit UvrB [bacterium]
MSRFILKAAFKPTGDQPQAIRGLSESILAGNKHQTLVGVTGSGKTFSMANIIREVDLPTLIISHNKTLAAQLFGEFSGFFPDNAVEFFISYYDYYQPEAFVPATSTYIEKDASINEDIDRLRMNATSSLLTRDDVVVIASVSSIFGLGNPDEFKRMVLRVKMGEETSRKKIIRRLVEIQYQRNDIGFGRGNFRVRGDVIDVYPAYEERCFRIELFGDEVERLEIIDPLTGKGLEVLDEMVVFPAKQFVTGRDRLDEAVNHIARDLETRLHEFRNQDKLLEAQRLESRTRYDLEMLQEMGFCNGIENYSRYLDGREPGQRPLCLLDYFPDDFLIILDESHVTVPQIGAMYAGDRSRKTTLVNYGFRLPSALDNRPLRFEEFEELAPRILYASATPAPLELEKSMGNIHEQVIRPTGLLDPVIEIRPGRHQVDDLLAEVKVHSERGERVLVTTLTKRMSEDLTDYLQTAGVRVAYLHSDIKALERVEILRKLRLGQVDVLVGINLLREGLDLPEVSLVAILDADKQGFLRSHTSLIQTAGRAARHAEGKVIFYADNETAAIRSAVEVTRHRRNLQERYNSEHGITPRTISKSLDAMPSKLNSGGKRKDEMESAVTRAKNFASLPLEDRIMELEEEMLKEADAQRFEAAASLRDLIAELKMRLIQGLEKGEEQ